MKLTSENQYAEVDLTNGAAVTELTLWNGEVQRSIISGESDYPYASSILFPFPNRISDGRYRFNGNEFAFPHNDFGRPNALHGFVADKQFEVIHSTENSLTAEYNYDGTFEYFPFPFILRCSYELKPGVLDIVFEIVNAGAEDMPFGLGWHPYFHVDEGVESTFMKLPAVIQYELDVLSIPTGVTADNTDFNSFSTLNGQALDDCFNSGNGEPAYIKYADGHLLEIYRDETFPFLQIYTPDDHKSVAIEPMTCGVNAWNIDNPIPSLGAGDKFNGNMGVRFIKAQ